MLELVQADINGKNHVFLNTKESVGVGGVNRMSDIMLIQAMLIYVSDLAHFDGFKSEVVIPKAVDGIYNEQTGLSIISYQLNYGSSIMKADGIIHPPSYENRKINAFGKRVMTMTLLQLQAHRIAKMRGLPNYVTDLPNIVELMVWIKRH